MVSSLKKHIYGLKLAISSYNTSALFFLFIWLWPIIIAYQSILKPTGHNQREKLVMKMIEQLQTKIFNKIHTHTHTNCFPPNKLYVLTLICCDLFVFAVFHSHSIEKQHHKLALERNFGVEWRRCNIYTYVYIQSHEVMSNFRNQSYNKC